MKIMERLIQKVDRTAWAKKIAIENATKSSSAVGLSAIAAVSRFHRRERNEHARDRTRLEQPGAYLTTIEKALLDPEWQALGADRPGSCSAIRWSCT